MNTNELNDIHSMIQQDLATSRQLLAILEKENNSTQARDYVNMSQLLKEKTPLLEQLRINAQQRSNWLSSLNCTPNENNWNKLLQSLNSEDIQKQWDSVKDTIEHCQKINNVNGKLISRGAKSHERLLQLMCGKTQQADIYDARGSKHSTSFSGTLTQA